MRHFPRTSLFHLESLESRRLLNALTVSNAADSGVGSLRAQIAAAQSGDSISFAPNLAGQTITLTSGEIAIAKNLTIDGLGGSVSISGNDQSRIFNVIGSATRAEIRNLNIISGKSNAGGAIYNAGILSISASSLYFSNASIGGAIYNMGSLTVSNSLVGFNRVLSTAYNVGGVGGGIYSGGPMTISNSTIVGNSAHGAGSSLFYLYDEIPTTVAGNAWGAGLYLASGPTSIEHSTIVSNWAVGGTDADWWGVGVC